MGHAMIFSGLPPVGSVVAGGILVTGKYRSTVEQRTSALRLAKTAALQLDPGVRESLIARRSPYLAVRVLKPVSRSQQPRSIPADPSAKIVDVMVYDLEKGRMATKEVFEVAEEPEPGEFAEFDTYFTHYVGGSEDVDTSSETEEP
tara:strand:+ start:2231 stop:2668 length:438 start_codon:yes stop_codon:yes gene_type:complete